MATGDLEVALILKLVDQLTGPVKPAIKAMRQIGDITEQTGRAGVAWSNEQLAANQARRSALQGEAMGLFALGGSLVALTEPAIQAERRLAEVSKVVSFDGPTGFAQLQTEIRELVTSNGLATTAEGVTDIVAAAGRMGVVDENLPDAQKRKELLEFAIAASKMSVAFGISADEAGTTLARWRQNLSLTQQEAMTLGDTVNFLGNTMATNEADILTVINRQGVVAQSAGLASSEIAALSATLLAAGASPEIAATGLKNFTNALTKGESITKRQSAVYDALGIDAALLAKRMQDDATGGIMSVLEAFQKIEPYRRSSMVGDLFGEEGKGAIMPLIVNLDMLRSAFAETADTASLLGLMEEEYQRQADTTFAARQRLFEYLKGLSVVIGSTVLPMLNDLMDTIMPVIAQFTQWAAAHPELIQMALKAALALLAFKAASIALRFAIFTLLAPVLHLIRGGAWLLSVFPQIAGALIWLAKGPLKLLLAGVGLISKAFIRLGLLMLANPIGLIIASVAVLAKVVYDNWDRIVSFFIEKVDEVKSAFDDGLLNGVFKLLSEFNPFTLAVEGMQGLLAYVMDLLGVPDEIVAAFRDLDLFQSGVDLIQSLWDGMLSLIDQVVGSIVAKLTSLKPQWLTDLQGWSASGVPNGTSERIAALSKPHNEAVGPGGPMRDLGGPVRAGMPYLVGERNPEIFVPGVSGSILPSRVLKAAMAATALTAPLVAEGQAQLSDTNIVEAFDRRPAINRSAPAPQITRQGDTFHITIAPPPGTDEETIVRILRREMDRRQNARRADLHDGVDY